MYVIVSNGEVVGLCDEPNYIRKKDGIWIEARADEAEAIAIGGNAYELENGAFAKKIDGGTYTFNESRTSAAKIDYIAMMSDIDFEEV